MKSAFYHEARTREQLAAFVAEAEVFSMDTQCRQFEESFAAKQSRKYAVFVSSGSMANLLLVQALLNIGKLRQGDRVGVSALTWATNVMPLLQLGLQPVALDCRLETLNVPPGAVEECDGDIGCLFLTNVLGFCDDVQRIQDICSRRNIVLLEDNCESLGSKIGGKHLGNFGLAATFSFFIGHHLSTIEGGMVCTDDEELYVMLVMARAHGWDRNLSPERRQLLQTAHGVDDFYSQYTFYDLAYNCRPTEIQGFLGNAQLQYWDEIIAKRAENFKAFQEAGSANGDFHHLRLAHMETISNFAMPLVCTSRALCAAYRRKFSEAAVEIRPIISGDITRQPFYQKYVREGRRCHNAQVVHENGFYFPNNPELTPDDVARLRSLLA